MAKEYRSTLFGLEEIPEEDTEGLKIEKLNPFRVADSLTQFKEVVVTDENEKEYAAYIVNKHFSNVPDAIFQANEMNLNSHLDKKLQHDYYFHSLRKKKMYGKWFKKDKKLEALLESIKKYYGYNDGKAKEALKILSKDQIAYILAKVNPS